MNPVRAAIFERLEGDSDLMELATGGVWWESATEGTQPPLVIVAKATGRRIYTFDGPPIRNELYLIRGVGQADDSQALDEMIIELLSDYPLTVDGYSLLLAPMPDDDISYEDNQYGENFQHTGTYYRVMRERASS